MARLEVESAIAARGGAVAVSIRGFSPEPVAGFSFAISHDPSVLRLERVDPSPELVAHGAELVFRRVENDEEPPFGAILVVLDGNPPLGDVPPLDLEEGLPLATFTYLVSDEASVDRSSSLDLAHREYGTPPIAAEFVLPDLTTVLPELTDAEVLIVDEPVFLRGDCNQDAEANISDVSFLLLSLFEGGVAPDCLDACDTNDDGLLDVSDAVRALLFLFAGGAPPPWPHPLPGLDTSDDELSCLQSADT